MWTSDNVRLVSYFVTGCVALWAVFDLLRDWGAQRRSATTVKTDPWKRFGGVFVAVLGILAFMATYSTDRLGQAEQRESDLAREERIRTIETKNRSLTTHTQQLQSQLEREKTARGLSEDELARAATAAHVVASGAALSAADTRLSQQFQPLDRRLLIALRNGVAKWVAAAPGYRVAVQIESGDTRRFELAREVGSVLEQHGVGSFDSTSTYVGNAPGVPITLRFSAGQRTAAAKFASALSPLIKSTITLVEDPSMPSGSLFLYVNGVPSFRRDGTVEVR